MRPDCTRSCGFILLAALAILAAVGVAILALASAMSYDGRRTMERAQRAQLDQLLLAGATQAAEHFKAASPKAGDAWDVELPEILLEQDAKLHATVESADESTVALIVTARVSNRSAEQVLKLERGAGGWKIASAEIPF